MRTKQVLQRKGRSYLNDLGPRKRLQAGRQKVAKIQHHAAEKSLDKSENPLTPIQEYAPKSGGLKPRSTSANRVFNGGVRPVKLPPSSSAEIVRTLARYGPGWALAGLVVITTGRIGLAAVSGGLLLHLLR